MFRLTAFLRVVSLVALLTYECSIQEHANPLREWNTRRASQPLGLTQDGRIQAFQVLFDSIQ
jgi:hypothetical protein